MNITRRYNNAECFPGIQSWSPFPILTKNKFSCFLEEEVIPTRKILFYKNINTKANDKIEIKT